MHCGDQRHLGLCLGYVPALAYGSCRVSDQGTTLRASDLHNARATILNPFNYVNPFSDIPAWLYWEVRLRRNISVWISFTCFMMTSSNGKKSALLAICAGYSTVTGEFPTRRPVTRRFDVLDIVRLNKLLSKHWLGWWIETPSYPLWRHSNVPFKTKH